MRNGLLLAIFTAAILAIACGPAARPDATPSLRERAATAWHDAAQCMRDHGFPIPDPTIDDLGHATLPADLPRTPDDVIAACQTYLDRIPDTADSRAPTAEFIRARRQFAECMRANGVPLWPDPDSEGRFPDSPALIAEGKTPALVTAQRTCAHYLNGGGT